MIRTISLILFSFICFQALAQNTTGYDLKVEIDGYTKDTLILGYYLGNNQYVRDTTVRTSEGFRFQGDTSLPTGMYLVIVPPLNDIIQLLIDENQHFNIHAGYDNGVKDISIDGDPDNELYYEYVNFIKEKRPMSNSLKKTLDSLEEGTEIYTTTLDALRAVDESVKQKTQSIIDANPTSYTALVLRANQEIDIPEFEGEEKDVQLKRFRYFKKHYYQNMHLDDERMFRTPYLYDRVNYYTDKLTMRDPDSINQSVDEILAPLEPNEQAFQFYLVHFLNKYAKSKVVGQDGVYVHLAEEYYAKGRAPWTDDEQLNKIVKNARDLKPTLLGQVAPDATLENRDGEKVTIHGFEADFLVLYFWSPDCPHCKKSTPILIDFYNQYKDQGVKVVTICGKTGKDVGQCWEYVDSTEEMDMLYNLTDEYYRSKFKSLYYVKTTPKIFVLDKDKKILSKGIGAEQLTELMTFLLQSKSEENN